MFAQKGQILLVVILVVVIASTIGLSLVSRSITGIRTSTEETEAQKALAAAEAGLERSIQENSVVSVGGSFDNASSYNTEYSEIIDSSFLLNGGSKVVDPITEEVLSVTPNIITRNEGADIWFVGRNSDGTPNYSSQVNTDPPDFKFNLYWGSVSDGECDIAALQIIVFTRDPDSGEVKSYRYAYDGCSTRNNGFTQVSSGNYKINGAPTVGFKFITPKNELVRSNTILIRVVPLYANTIVGVSACDYDETYDEIPATCTELPSQGYVVTSTGTSGNSNRKISVFKGYPQTYLPYVSYGLFVAND